MPYCCQISLRFASNPFKLTGFHYIKTYHIILSIYSCTKLTARKFSSFIMVHSLIDFDPRYFWAWTDFQSYLDFMLVFWAIGAAGTYLLLNIEWFMETVGFFAVFTEAMLGK